MKFLILAACVLATGTYAPAPVPVGPAGQLALPRLPGRDIQALGHPSYPSSAYLTPAPVGSGALVPPEAEAIVNVCGQVAYPGPLRSTPGMTLEAAIGAAGLFLRNADLDAILVVRPTGDGGTLT